MQPLKQVVEGREVSVAPLTREARHLARRASGRTTSSGWAGAVLVLLGAFSAFGQGGATMNGPVRGAALANYGDLLHGAISIEVEPRLTSWLGVELGLGMKGFRGLFDAADLWPVYAFGEVGVRVYPLRDGPAGLWFGPTARGLALMPKDVGPSPQAFGWGLGGAVGYHLVIAPRLVLQLALGGGVIDLGAGLRFEPRLRLGLGFLF
jgi:hypothetical protein